MSINKKKKKLNDKNILDLRLLLWNLQIYKIKHVFIKKYKIGINKQK